MTWAGAWSRSHTTGLARLCCILTRLVRAPEHDASGGEHSLPLDPLACECVGVRQEESPWPSGCHAS
jgi:hypothetical protein